MHELHHLMGRYQRLQIHLEKAPEPLTSNWLKLLSAPDEVFYLSPKGSVVHSVMLREAKSFQFPLVQHNRGFWGFCLPEEMVEHFLGTGRFEVLHQVSIEQFLESGCPEMDLEAREARSIFVQIMREAWERYCTKLGLLRREYSASSSFHVSDPLVRIGQKIPWGRQGDKRSSMLRNIAKKKVWEFGMTAIPSLYPFPHYRLKSRVLFSEVANEKDRGETIEDTKTQHRLRRSVCSAWRNPAWYGRLMAYLEILAQESAQIRLPVSNKSSLCVDAMPLTATSPVSIRQAQIKDGDAEEEDETTLPPNFYYEEDE